MCKQFKSIIDKSLNLFKKYNDPDVFGDVDIVALKQKCLQKAINEKGTRDYGRDSFLRDYAKRVRMLLDSVYFDKWCEEHQVDVFSAATHVVHLGVMKVRQVIYDDVLEFGQPQLDFYPEWRMPLYSKEDLLGRLRFEPVGLLPASEEQAVILPF